MVATVILTIKSDNDINDPYKKNDDDCGGYYCHDDDDDNNDYGEMFAFKMRR